MPLSAFIRSILADPARLTLPEGGRLGPTDIQFTGDRIVEVSLCAGICRYREDEIALRVREGLLIVRGTGLSLRTYRSRRIAVCGKIDGVYFERKPGKK